MLTESWFTLIKFWITLREAAQEKKWTNFGTFPKGGGVKAKSKVKGALFATDRFPLGYLSSYLTSMVVLHFSYLINYTLETLTMCWVIKNNIKNVDLKSAPMWSKVQGGSWELWESSKVSPLFFGCSFAYRKFIYAYRKFIYANWKIIYAYWKLIYAYWKLIYAYQKLLYAYQMLIYTYQKLIYAYRKLIYAYQKLIYA